MAEIINIKDLRDKSLFDLSPEDQKKRFKSYGFPEPTERILKILVNDYEIKLKAVLDRFDKHIINSSVMSLVNDAARQNMLNMAIYNQLHLNNGDMTKEGEEYYRQQVRNKELMPSLEAKKASPIFQTEESNSDEQEKTVDNQVDEPRFYVYQATGTVGPGAKPLVDLQSDFQNEYQKSIDIIDGDSIFEGDIKPANYSEVGDEMYPKDDATHNYSVYNSDQELTPDRVTEFAKETEENSIAPGKEREYKKQRRKTVMKTLGALLAAAAAVALIYVGIKAAADDNSKEDLDNAERAYNATHKYVQMLNENGIDTPEEYSDHIDHFEGKAQLDELSKIAIGEMETPFEEIENPKDIINDKEVIENMDEIKEENIADGGNLRQEMFKGNGGDEAMGSWRDSSYNRVVKSLVRK